MPDGDPIPHGNIALLIDADNAQASALDDVLTILAELGSVNIRRAYGNWTKAGLKSWAQMTHRHAIEPHQQFDITKGKNATDMKMTIDAMDLLYSNRVDGFGIMSSDSDFMPVAMRIRQNGLPVYGFGSSRTPEGFRQACTRFIDLQTLKENQDVQPDTASEKPARSPRAASKQPVDEELVRLLGEAWKASKRDERGYAPIGELGQRFNARSSFDARSYGFSRLSELIASLPQFDIETREGNRQFVRRMR
jgi:uncharacterized protein (TIGR00288 family)